MSKRTKDALEDALLGSTAAVQTSRLGRVWSTGRAAMGLARTALRRDGVVDEAALEQLTTRLGSLKGLGMKLGQIFSYVDPSLPPEARRMLSVLQTRAPASPPEAVRRTVERAFGDRASTLLSAMNPRPFSVASIGQVHRATLPGVGDVVVKVLHEGIIDALQADFASARAGVTFADTLMLGAAADAKAAVEEVRAVMLAECDFAREADHQRAFGRWLSSDPSTRVPEVVDAWSASTVLTSRDEPGATLDAFLEAQPSQAERNRAGAALFHASVGGLYALGRLHADPHPGNFAFRDGRVVLYDFGCVRTFEPRHVRALAGLVSALRANDHRAVMAAASAFGFDTSTPERQALLLRFTRGFFFPVLQRGAARIPADRPAELKDLLADKRALAKLGLPPHAMFLLRLRFGLYAVLSRLEAEVDWGALEERLSTAVREAA
ncbi:MAG: AarF/UbiB family protein [Myxococcaceae bacterium]